MSYTQKLHLDEKLFIDRVDSTQELMSESEYHRQIISQLPLSAS